jgi:hypothetical protein
MSSWVGVVKSVVRPVQAGAPQGTLHPQAHPVGQIELLGPQETPYAVNGAKRAPHREAAMDRSLVERAQRGDREAFTGLAFELSSIPPDGDTGVSFSGGMSQRHDVG